MLDNFETNDTLLISETLGKVILPYTKQEVEELLRDENNQYETFEQVVEDKFTRNFTEYKYQFFSRYKETMKLATEREKYGKADAITLAIEMMNKRYLHPAIISACRTLDELDVYIDCLEKNELDDFKIFNIKYELHPLIVKGKGEKELFERTSTITKIKKVFKRSFNKKVSKHMKYD